MKNIYLGAFLFSISLFYNPVTEDSLSLTTEKNTFSETEEIYIQAYMNNSFDLLNAQKKNWREINIYLELEEQHITTKNKDVKLATHISIDKIDGEYMLNLEKLFGEISAGQYRIRALLESELLLKNKDTINSNWTTLSIIKGDICSLNLPELNLSVDIQMNPSTHKASVYDQYALQNYSVTNLSNDTLVYEEPIYQKLQVIFSYEPDCNPIFFGTGIDCMVGGIPTTDQMIYPGETYIIKGFVPNKQGVYHLVDYLKTCQKDERIKIYSPAVRISGYSTERPTDRWTDF